MNALLVNQIEYVKVVAILCQKSANAGTSK